MLPAASRSRAAQAVIGTSASQAAIVFLVFATSVAQARLLGPFGRGELALFLNAGGLFVLLFGFGIGSAITYFVASDAAQPQTLLRSLVRAFTATVVATLACTGVVVATPVRQLLPHTISEAWLVVALTLYFAATQATAWQSGILAARVVFAPINWSAVLVAATAAAVSAGLLLAAPSWADASVIIGMMIVLEFVRAASLAAYLIPRRWLNRPGMSAEVRHPGENVLASVWRYSGLAFVGDTLQFLTYRIDLWVVAAFHGTVTVGVYALAVSLAQLVWIVPGAIARVLFPYAAMPETADRLGLAVRAARFAFLASAACALAGWIGSELFLTVLFGDDFSAAPTLIGILMLGIVPFSVVKVLGNYLAGVNAIALNVMSAGATLAITIALDFLLIPRFGAGGAAWATAASYVIQSALVVGFFLRRSGLPLRSLIRLRTTVS